MLKTCAFVIFAGITIIAGLWALTRAPMAVINQKDPLPMEINYNERVKRENAGIPKQLSISALNMYSVVEEVTLDPSGYMFSPIEESNLGWYYKSSRLGD